MYSDWHLQLYISSVAMNNSGQGPDACVRKWARQAAAFMDVESATAMLVEQLKGEHRTSYWPSGRPHMIAVGSLYVFPPSTCAVSLAVGHARLCTAARRLPQIARRRPRPRSKPNTDKPFRTRTVCL